MLANANSTSFDLGALASSCTPRTAEASHGFQKAVEEVIGFIKLVHKLNAAEVVVRRARGPAPSSPPTSRLSLPRSQCTQIGFRRRVVRSLSETRVSGEQLSIRVRTAA